MRAYERLIHYAKVFTTSDEETGTHPSFEGEFVLAKMLVDELKHLGVEDAFVDEKCYVYGHIPATKGYEDKTRLGFIAHMDTAPDASGKNVNPQIIPDYDGNLVKLGTSGKVLDPEKFSFLKKFVGETLITTDGTTLLGADDKAGISEIMTAIERLSKENIPHGPLSIAFTPDEEIGEGADFFDLDTFHAEYAYTVDGGDVDGIEDENFNAAGATITVHGVSVHPGDAKDVMVNASNVAMELHALLPKNERPEHTSGREGFFHLTDMKGEVSEAKLQYIIRDHDHNRFEVKKELMREAVSKINEIYGEGTVELKMKDSYYNMLEKIRPHMHLVENAMEAVKEVGFDPIEIPIRGGTDGARLSYMGLPCPNLGTGGYNFHGELECITAERMDKATKVIVKLVQRYSK